MSARNLSSETKWQVASKLADLLGSINVADVAELAAIVARDHPTNQQNVMRFCASFINAVAYARGGHDGRNAASIKFAREVVASTDDSLWSFPYL